MQMEREIRYFAPEKIETRADESGGKSLAGYAAVYERDSELIWGEFIERIDPGAFKRTLEAGRDIKAFWNHNSDLVLGSTRAGTLKLECRQDGLWFDLNLPRTTYGADAFESVRRGDVAGVSFGFECRAHKWEKRQGVDVRTLLDVELYEVSPCAMPAYPDTSVAVRSLEQTRKEQESQDQNDMRRLYLALTEREII